MNERRTSGFTLVELLLVLAIIGVVTAVTLPSLTRAIRGNRLRTATKTIVMAGRYARSMAVLKQTDMILSFDLNAGSISVQPAGGQAPPPADDAQDDGMAEDGTVAGAEPDTPEWWDDARLENELDDFDDEAGASFLRSTSGEDISVARKLDRVKIVYVDRGRQKIRCEEGSCSIRYRTNGTCEPYELRLTDQRDMAVVLEVVAFAAAKTEQK